MEDLKHGKSAGGGGGGGGGGGREEGGEGGVRESPTPFVKNLLGASVLPPPSSRHPIFGPQCLAKRRGVIKSPILVGTIIMLVALVRHLFHYLSS